MPRSYTTANGLALTFTKAGSYRYPLIYRVSDGETIRHWHNRPFSGRVSDAVLAVRKIADTGCSLEGITSRDAMTPEQLAFLERLNRAFADVGGGFCAVASA